MISRFIDFKIERLKDCRFCFTSLIILILQFSNFSIFQSHAQLGINTESPDPSAILDIQAPNKGLLPPVMSSANRLAINNPANALLVYDSTVKDMMFYDSMATEWVRMSPYENVSLGTDGCADTLINNNWLAINVQGGPGYFLNVHNKSLTDTISFFDGGRIREGYVGHLLPNSTGFCCSFDNSIADDDESFRTLRLRNNTTKQMLLFESVGRKGHYVLID